MTKLIYIFDNKFVLKYQLVINIKNYSLKWILWRS